MGYAVSVVPDRPAVLGCRRGSHDLTGIAGWVVDVMERLGGFGAGPADRPGETSLPPLPSEIVPPLAGFAASRGSFSLTSAIVWTTAGSVVGALVLYLLGAAWGRERLFAIWERMPLVNARLTSSAPRRGFVRHGAEAVFFAADAAAVPEPDLGAGRRSNGCRCGSSCCSRPWAVRSGTPPSILAGYLLGEQWHLVEPIVGWFQCGGRRPSSSAVVAWWVVRRVRSATRGNAW